MLFQTFQITGVIDSIGQDVVFSEKYTERVFVVKYSSSADYSYNAALILANTKIGMINDFNVGDSVVVHFNISSRSVRGAYYTKLNVWKIEHQH